MIKQIAKHIRIDIFSLQKRYERMGTKTYPKDSIIGMSFTLTPYFNAIISRNTTPTKIA